MAQSHWQPGDAIVYREVWQGRVWTGRPVTLVQDDPELIALYLADGTHWQRPEPLDASEDLFGCLLPGGDWRLVERVLTHGDSLLLIRPGEAHAVHVMWRGREREFAGWYVNLQEPLRRTALGFDFMDQELDIVVRPDLSGWAWKDEDRLARAVEAGRYTHAEAKAIRAEGERTLARLLAGEFPFDSHWEFWRPPREWPVPSLPEGWDRL
jgi:hypothetical protein